MANTPDEAQEALARQQERAENLAEEKSHLQLIIHMMEGLSTVPGLDNTIDNMLRLILDNIGGTDLILYYWVDSDLFRTDVFGNRAKLSAIEDDLVKKTFETRTSIEQDHDFSDTQMMTPEFTKARTLVYPLLVGSELIGILKLDGIYAAPHELKKELPTFFNYAALILKSAILGHTELKQVNDRLKRSQALLDATGQMAKVGGWEIDLSSQRLTWTREVYRIHEVSEDFQPTVAAGIDFYAPESKPVIAEAVQRAIERGEVFDVQLKIITARKNRRWVHARGEARSQDGKIVTVVGTIQDITELKRADGERRELEKQLHEKQKLAAVGTLACGMGHEINNPIMGIINYAQLIKDRLQGKDANVEEFADEIAIEAERVAGIVRKLSAFATRDIATRAAIPVSDLIESALAPLRDALTHDQIALEVNVPDNLPAVVCDRGQIAQVLTSLLNNARDALNERYPGHDENKIMRVTARELDAEHRTLNTKHVLRITVEDHGAGIPLDVREHIFEPFFTTKDKSVGAGNIGKGLGLFVSHAYVQDHGGVLTVESDPGQWTRFYLDLPVMPVQDAVAHQAVGKESEAV